MSGCLIFYEVRMLKWLLCLIIVFSVVNCGKKEPVITGVDLPPDNNVPINIAPVPVAPSNNNAPQAIPQPVHVFEAPLVLVRGDIPQQSTTMNTAPGS